MPDRSVLAAYQGQRRLFRAFVRDGRLLSEPATLSDADRSRVDSLVFARADGAPLCWIPVLRGRTERLRVALFGADLELQVKCRIRCFLSSLNDSIVPLAPPTFISNGTTIRTMSVFPATPQMALPLDQLV